MTQASGRQRARGQARRARGARRAQGARRVAAALLVATAAAAAGVPSAAAETAPASEAEIFGIMRSVTAQGAWSPEQRERVLTRPDVAAGLVDPTSGRLMADDTDRLALRSRGTQSANALLAYATRQTTADRFIRYYSPTGGAVLDYHFTVTWNHNGSTVTSTPSRSHYIRSYTWSIYDRGLTSNSAVRKPGGYAYTVTMQGEWEQCIAKYGCIAQDNPYTQYGVYFDGTYHLRQVR